MKAAIFLDRDGVLNKTTVRNGKPYAPRNVADFILYPGTNQCLTTLKARGFLLFVVTNQPDVGNGLTAKEDVHSMHKLLHSLSSIDHIEICFHSQSDNCLCRKPRTGMLTKLTHQYKVDTAKSYMIGDRGSDITAGNTMRLKTILIDRQYSEPINILPWKQCRSLAEATKIILSDHTGQVGSRNNTMRQS